MGLIDDMASFWGETGLDEIPELEGVRVMVLWPPHSATGGWDASYFKPIIEAAPPALRFEKELSREEAGLWFERLEIDVEAIQKSKSKPWWKIW